MSEFVSLNGRRCRKVGEARRPADEYYYTVVTSFLTDAHVLKCAVVNRRGGTNVLNFVELEFEPRESER